MISAVFFKRFYCLFLIACLHICVRVHAVPMEAREGFGSLVVGVTGNCEPPSVDSGNQLQFSRRAASALTTGPPLQQPGSCGFNFNAILVIYLAVGRLKKKKKRHEVKILCKSLAPGEIKEYKQNQIKLLFSTYWIVILMSLADIPSESGLTLFLKNEEENNRIKMELLVLLNHIINS